MKRKSKILTRKRVVLLFCLVVFCLIAKGQIVTKGSYLNRVNSSSIYRLKIIPIDDTLVYYELMQIYSNNKYIKENKTMGVSICKMGVLRPLNSYSFQKKLYGKMLNERTFFIDSNLASFYPTFNDFGGKFLMEKRESSIKPDYSLFYRVKYYEEHTAKDRHSLNLYEYPVICKHKKVLTLMKGMEVRSLMNVFDCKTDGDSFYYISVREKGSEWKYGWIDSDQFNKLYFLWKVKNGEKWIKGQ